MVAFLLFSGRGEVLDDGCSFVRSVIFDRGGGSQGENELSSFLWLFDEQ